MSLKIVNKAPGDVTDPIKPGQTIQFGMRSETKQVTESAMGISAGFTGLLYDGALPDSGTLVSRGATVNYASVERRQPVTGAEPYSISAGNLVITKSSNDLGKKSIFEIGTSSSKYVSLLAYFKILKASWTSLTPDWAAYTDMACPYLALVSDVFNTGVFIFLRQNGTGSLVIGGPLQQFSTARPGEVEVALPWTALPNGSAIELYVILNIQGYSSPFSPAGVPLVEVYAKLPTDLIPVLLHRSALSLFGFFKTVSSGFPNARQQGDASAAYFGNAGASGDVLTLADWAFYPDYRFGLHNGVPRPDSAIFLSPNGPCGFISGANSLPRAQRPGRWFLDPFSTEPVEELKYLPGKKANAQYTRVTRAASGTMAYSKEESRIGQEFVVGPLLKKDGFTIEAFMAGVAKERILSDCLGVGFQVEDGSRQYVLSMLEGATRRTVGVLKTLGGIGDLATGYYIPPQDVDFRTLKHFRMDVDKYRDALNVYLDGARIIGPVTLSTATIPASVNRRVSFGHVLGSATTGYGDFGFLSYCPRYLAWEGEDNKKPDDGTLNPNIQFTEVSSGVSSTSIASSVLTIDKQSVNVPNSCCYYSRTGDVSIISGLQLDFRCKVASYISPLNVSLGPNCWIGSGVRVDFGVRSLILGFFDCGPHGRKIAVIPGSGTENDIINQTSVGPAFSADTNWLLETDYRIVVKGYNKIEVYVGAPTNPPAITIPWKSFGNDFDLPSRVATAGVSFGHFQEGPASKTLWSHMRMGVCDGYDVAFEQRYPEGTKDYHFGGKALIWIGGDEA